MSASRFVLAPCIAILTLPALAGLSDPGNVTRIARDRVATKPVTVERWDARSPQRLVRIDGKLYQEQDEFYYRVIDRQITVRLSEGVASWAELVSRVRAASPASARELEKLEPLRKNRLGIVDLGLPAGEDPAEWCKRVFDSGLVKYAEVATEGAYQLTPADPRYAEQWALNNTGQAGGVVGADIRAETAWDLTTGDPAVIVAVIDSGTDVDHEDLAANVWHNEGEIPGNSQDDDGNGYVDDWEGWDFDNNNNDPRSGFYHGTHVTGIVNAATDNGVGIAGIAGGFGGPGVRAMALGVGETAPNGAVLDDAILYAADNGARVITLSLSVGQTQAIDDALDYAYNTLDVFIDCAAGNNGASVSYPGTRPEVMAVASSTPSDTRSSFSNPGPQVEVAAPGSDILSTQLGNTYGTSSGTSFAAPQVAGLAALMRSLNPDLSAADLRQLIIDTADDIESPGFDNLTGHGRINAFAALSMTASPDGRVRLDRELYSCADTVQISVTDTDLAGAGSIVISVTSGVEPGGESVTLTDTGSSAGLFVGSISTAVGAPAPDGELQVAHGGTITAEYVDADDGQGGTSVLKTAVATVDCAPPVITGVAATDVTGASARILWFTDEPADGTVQYGLAPPGSAMVSAETLVQSHAVKLTGLDECSVYYFSVASADAVGNAASEDNGGALFTFETGRNVNPSYDSADTPLEITDNTTTDSVIEVAETKLVLDVVVGVNLTHTYDGDLRLSLISPTGTTITLSNRRGGSGDGFIDTIFDDEAITPISAGSAPFTGSFVPDSPLSEAEGIEAAGEWTLRVEDLAGGDQGSLDGWTLTLLYPAQVCGPHARSADHVLQVDACSTGGVSAGNGYWDAGEEITFGLAVENDGTDPLTGLSAALVPLNPGVVMTEGAASYPDLPEQQTAYPLLPFAAELPEGLGCGDTLDFTVFIRSNEGEWTGTMSQTVGEIIPGGGTALFEDFEGGLPNDWTVIDGLSDGNTWYVDDATDPGGCANTDPNPPISGFWMAVDSDCTGSGVPMDEELISPPIDVSAALDVTLEFDHYLNHLGPETADLDVRSSLTGGQWVNVASWAADTPNPEHVSFDITALAAGASDLSVRWHYYDADFEWYWYIDNVHVGFTTQSGCDMPICTGIATSPPPIPDGSLSTQPVRANRLNGAGTQLLIEWDPLCSPASAKILYGDLAGMSSYALDGAVCGIAQPHLWDPAPPGDLWFLIVSDDGLGAESSWGLSTAGERNGSLASGQCGSSVKDLSAICP